MEAAKRKLQLRILASIHHYRKHQTGSAKFQGTPHSSDSDLADQAVTTGLTERGTEEFASAAAGVP